MLGEKINLTRTGKVGKVVVAGFLGAQVCYTNFKHYNSASEMGFWPSGKLFFKGYLIFDISITYT